MPYRIRVRLYRGAQLEADTDPDLGSGEPGAEVVATLDDTQAALVELCQAMHGPAARLLGLSGIAMDAYGCMVRERAQREPQFSYSQGYSVLTGHYVEWWKAHVDIAVTR